MDYGGNFINLLCDFEGKNGEKKYFVSFEDFERKKMEKRDFSFKKSIN